MSRYAIVPTAGCHGSGEKVRPLAVLADRFDAHYKARQKTRQFQDGMRPHGGSSGGYRVIVVDQSVKTRDDVEWFGHELDRIPSDPSPLMVPA